MNLLLLAQEEAGISLVTDVQLICQQVMNDLLTIIKVSQQRSRMIRLNIITARRFLASKNPFQLAKEQGFP